MTRAASPARLLLPVRVAVTRAVVLLAVLAPVLVTVSTGAVRVVELLLLVRSGGTLLLRGGSSLSTRSDTLALGVLRLESVVRGRGLGTGTGGGTGGRSVHSEEVVQATRRRLRLVRLRGLGLLSSLQF